MNYRHAYHAGNHTEVFKHSVLCLLVSELCRKPKPFVVLDTHAGAGGYDLGSPEAAKTGESADGIARIVSQPLKAASVYLDVVRRLNPEGLRQYPGSPMLVQALLRDNDRLIACELREDDSAMLRARFRGDPRISVHHRDGYEAIGAFVPPTPRRGLVFVDPPFERRDEYEQLSRALNAGLRKWPQGIFVAWYPVKDGWKPQELRAGLDKGNPPTLCCEFLRDPVDGVRLAGSGVVIVNPPWRFEQILRELCRELGAAFASRAARFSVTWWTPPSETG